MQEQAIANHGRPCSEITMLVRSMRGGFSGGTIASLSNSYDSGRRDEESRDVLMDPYGMNPEGERDGRFAILDDDDRFAAEGSLLECLDRLTERSLVELLRSLKGDTAYPPILKPD